MINIGNREFERLIGFLRRSKKARRLFMTVEMPKRGIVIVYDPVADTIALFEEADSENAVVFKV